MEDLMNVISLTSSEDESTDQVTKKSASFTNEFKTKFDTIFSNHEYMSQTFPHLLFADLLNDIKHFMHNPKFTIAAKNSFWRNFLDKIYKPSLVSQYKIHKDIKYNRVLGAIMAEYLNFRCEILKLEIEKYPDTETARELHTQVKDLCQKLGATLLHMFNGNKDFVTFALLQVKPDKHYQVLLSNLFSNILSYYNKVTMEDHITYVRLILCFRRWKTLVSHATMKKAINEISRRVLPQNMSGRGSSETRDFLQILPKHNTDKENATNFLLNHKLLEGGLLEKAINRYFDAHEEHATTPKKAQKRTRFVKSSTLTQHNLNKFNHSTAATEAVILGDNSATIELSSDDEVICLTKSSDSNKHNVNNNLGLSHLDPTNLKDIGKIVPFRNQTSKCDNSVTLDMDDPINNGDRSPQKVVAENDADSESERDLHTKNNKLRRKKKKRKVFGKFRQNHTRYESTDSNSSIQVQDDGINCVRLKLKSQSSRNSSQVSSTTNIDSIVPISPESIPEKTESNMLINTKVSRENTQSPHISTSNFNEIPLSPVSLPSSSGIVEVGDKIAESTKIIPLYSDISDTEIDLNFCTPNPQITRHSREDKRDDSIDGTGGKVGNDLGENQIAPVHCESTIGPSPDSGVSGVNTNNSKENSDNEHISVSQVSPPPSDDDFILKSNIKDESVFVSHSPPDCSSEAVENTEPIVQGDEGKSEISKQNKCLKAIESCESEEVLQYATFENDCVHEIELEPQSDQSHDEEKDGKYHKVVELVLEEEGKSEPEASGEHQPEDKSANKSEDSPQVFEEIELSTIEYTHEETVEQTFVENIEIQNDRKEIDCLLIEPTKHETDVGVRASHPDDLKFIDTLNPDTSEGEVHDKICFINEPFFPIESESLKSTIEQNGKSITIGCSVGNSDSCLKQPNIETVLVVSLANKKITTLTGDFKRSFKNNSLEEATDHIKADNLDVKHPLDKVNEEHLKTKPMIDLEESTSQTIKSNVKGSMVYLEPLNNKEGMGDTCLSNCTTKTMTTSNLGELPIQRNLDKSGDSWNNSEIIESNTKFNHCPTSADPHLSERTIKCLSIPGQQFQRQEVLIESDKSNHVEFNKSPAELIAPVEILKQNIFQELSNLSYTYCQPDSSLVGRKTLTLVLDKKFENISDDELTNKSPITNSSKDSEIVQICSLRSDMGKPKIDFMTYLSLKPNSEIGIEEKPSVIISPTPSISKGRRTKPKCVRKLDTTKPLNALINLQLLATTAEVLSDKPEISKSPKLSRRRQNELKRSIKTKLNDSKRIGGRVNRVPTRSTTRNNKSLGSNIISSPITPKSILKPPNVVISKKDFNLHEGIWQQDRTSEILKTSLDLVKIDVSKLTAIQAIPSPSIESSDSDSDRLVIADCKVQFDKKVKTITTTGEFMTDLNDIKEGSNKESDAVLASTSNRRKKLTKTRDGNINRSSDSDEEITAIRSNWHKSSKTSSNSDDISNWVYEIDLLQKFDSNFPANDPFNDFKLPLIIEDIPIDATLNTESLLVLFKLRFIAIHRCINSFDIRNAVSPHTFKGVLEKLELIQSKNYDKDDLVMFETRLKDLDHILRKLKKIERDNDKLIILYDFLKCWDKRIKLRRKRLKTKWNTRDKVKQWHRLIKKGTEMKKNVLNLGNNVLKQKLEQPVSDFVQLEQRYKSPRKIFEDTLKNFVIPNTETVGSAYGDSIVSSTVKQFKPKLENRSFKSKFKNKSKAISVLPREKKLVADKISDNKANPDVIAKKMNNNVNPDTSSQCPPNEPPINVANCFIQNVNSETVHNYKLAQKNLNGDFNVEEYKEISLYQSEDGINENNSFDKTDDHKIGKIRKIAESFDKTTDEIKRLSVIQLDEQVHLIDGVHKDESNKITSQTHNFAKETRESFDEKSADKQIYKFIDKIKVSDEKTQPGLKTDKPIDDLMKQIDECLGESANLVFLSDNTPSKTNGSLEDPTDAIDNLVEKIDKSLNEHDQTLNQIIGEGGKVVNLIDESVKETEGDTGKTGIFVEGIDESVTEANAIAENFDEPATKTKNDLYQIDSFAVTTVSAKPTENPSEPITENYQDALEDHATSIEKTDQQIIESSCETEKLNNLTCELELVEKNDEFGILENMDENIEKTSDLLDQTNKILPLQKCVSFIQSINTVKLDGQASNDFEKEHDKCADQNQIQVAKAEPITTDKKCIPFNDLFADIASNEQKMESSIELRPTTKCIVETNDKTDMKGNEKIESEIESDTYLETHQDQQINESNAKNDYFNHKIVQYVSKISEPLEKIDHGKLEEHAISFEQTDHLTENDNDTTNSPHEKDNTNEIIDDAKEKIGDHLEKDTENTGKINVSADSSFQIVAPEIEASDTTSPVVHPYDNLSQKNTIEFVVQVSNQCQAELEGVGENKIDEMEKSVSITTEKYLNPSSDAIVSAASSENIKEEFAERGLKVKSVVEINDKNNVKDVEEEDTPVNKSEKIFPETVKQAVIEHTQTSALVGKLTEIKEKPSENNVTLNNNVESSTEANTTEEGELEEDEIVIEYGNIPIIQIEDVINNEQEQKQGKINAASEYHSPSESSVDYVEEFTKIETRSESNEANAPTIVSEEEDELIQREDKRKKVVQEIQSEIVKIISNTSEELRLRDENGIGTLKRHAPMSPETDLKSKVPKIEIVSSPKVFSFTSECIVNENSYSDSSCHSNKSGIDFPEYLVSNATSSSSQPSFSIPLITSSTSLTAKTELETTEAKSEGSDKLDIVESLISKNLSSSNHTDDELDLDGLRDFFCLYDEFDNHNVLDRSNTSLNWENEFPNSLNLTLGDLNTDNESSSDKNANLKKEKDCMISGNDDIRIGMTPWDNILYPLSYSMDSSQQTCVNMDCILENKNKMSPMVTESEGENTVSNATEPSSYLVVDIFANKSFDEVIYNEDQSNSTLVDQTIKELSKQLPSEEEMAKPQPATVEKTVNTPMSQSNDFDLVVYDPQGDTESNVESPNPSDPKNYQQTELITINHDDIKENDSKSGNFELINVFLNRRKISKESEDPIEILSDSSRSPHPSTSQELPYPIREDELSVNEEDSSLPELVSSVQAETQNLEQNLSPLPEESSSQEVELSSPVSKGASPLQQETCSIPNENPAPKHKIFSKKDDKLDPNVIILQTKLSPVSKLNSSAKLKLENNEIPLQYKSTPVPLSKHIPSKIKQTPSYTDVTPPTTPTKVLISQPNSKAEIKSNSQKPSIIPKLKLSSFKNGPLDMPTLDFDEDSNSITHFIIPKAQLTQTFPPLPPPLVRIQPPPPPDVSQSVSLTPSKPHIIKVHPVIETRAEMTSFLNASVSRVIKRPVEDPPNQIILKKSKVDKFDLVKSMPLDKISLPQTSSKENKSYSASHHSSSSLSERRSSLNSPQLNSPKLYSASSSRSLSPSVTSTADSNLSRRYHPAYLSSSLKEQEYRSNSVTSQSASNFSKPYPCTTKVPTKYVPISAPPEPTLRTYRSKSRLPEEGQSITRAPKFNVISKGEHEHSYSSSSSISLLSSSVSKTTTLRITSSEKNTCSSRSSSSQHYRSAPKNKYAMDLYSKMVEIKSNKNTNDVLVIPSWDPKQCSTDELLEDLKKAACHRKSNSSQLFN